MAIAMGRLASVGSDTGSVVRATAAGAIGGALAGMLVGGIGSRIAMRVSGAMSDPALVGIARTNNDNVLGVVTLGGTFALILFAGLLPGVMAGLIYVAARPWLAPLGRFGGLAYGLALLAAFGPLVIEPFNIDFRKFGSPLVNVALFALLFPLFGIAVAPLTDLVRRRLDGSPPATVSAQGPAWVAAQVVGLVMAALVLVLGGVSFVGSLVEGDLRDPRPFLLFYFLGVPLAARVLLGRQRGFGDARELGLSGRLVSYGILVTPALIGLPSTVEAITFVARPCIASPFIC